jgi:hypothetical protein
MFMNLLKHSHEECLSNVILDGLGMWGCVSRNNLTTNVACVFGNTLFFIAY